MLIFAWVLSKDQYYVRGMRRHCSIFLGRHTALGHLYWTINAMVRREKWFYSIGTEIRVVGDVLGTGAVAPYRNSYCQILLDFL
jgi:hypothetical protein